MKYLNVLTQFVIFLCGIMIVYLVPFITEWLTQAKFIAPITWGLCIGFVLGIIAGALRHIVTSAILLLCPFLGMFFNLVFDNEPYIYVFALAIFYSTVASHIMTNTWWQRDTS